MLGAFPVPFLKQGNTAMNKKQIQGIAEELNSDFSAFVESNSRPLTVREIKRVRMGVSPAILALCGPWDTAPWFCPEEREPNKPRERSYSYGEYAAGTYLELAYKTDTTQGGRIVHTVSVSCFF